MAMRSWELWRQLERDAGQTLLVKTGNLTLGPPDSPAVSGFTTSAQTYAIPHEVLTAAEVRKRWPQLAPPPDFVAGLEKEAGIVFPEMSVAAFLGEAQKAGADLVMDEPVAHWTEDAAGVQVRTAGSTYAAGRLLIAAGAWTCKLLGLPAAVLQPKRVPVHWIDMPPDDDLRLGRFPVNFWQVPAARPHGSSSAYQEFYTLPVTGPDGRIKAAFHNGLSDCDPDTLMRAVSPGELEKMTAVLAQFLPGFHGRPITSEVCLYTLTPDGHFYLGKRPGSDSVFGVALAGHGFKFAPVVGEIMADLMTDSAPAFDIDLFSALRFNAG
jgi:sarcosine oxidase